MEERDDELLAETIADILITLRSSTCVDMVSLWLDASAKLRSRWLGASAFVIAPNHTILRMSPSNRSKYRALAAWRFAVLWDDLLSQLETSRSQAVRAVYFTPVPNKPPYAYSRSAADCPGVPPGMGLREFKELARDGALELVGMIQHKARQCDASELGQRRRLLLELGCRLTVYEVLKEKPTIKREGR